jgi:hypothetical protein
MSDSSVMEVCKTQSQPEEGKMLDKNHDEDDADVDDDD